MITQHGGFLTGTSQKNLTPPKQPEYERTHSVLSMPVTKAGKADIQTHLELMKTAICEDSVNPRRVNYVIAGNIA